jgi:hypothetical protein
MAECGMNPNIKFFYAKFLTDFEKTAKVMASVMKDLDMDWLFYFISKYVKEKK